MAHRLASTVLVLAGGISASVASAQVWRQIFPTTSPGERGEHGMAYDSARDRMMVLGGWTPYYCCSCFRSHQCGWYDSWEMNATTWTQTSGIGDWLALHGMAFDESRGVTVAYGGHLYSWGYATDVVIEHPGAGPWIGRPSGPIGRVWPAMTYDADRQLVLMGGGSDVNQNPLVDLWEYDGTSWSPGPTPPGSIGRLAYDRARSRTVAVIGAAATGTWELSGTTWTQTTSTYPYGPMDYDASRRLVVACCTSEYDGVTWTQRPTAPQTTLIGTRVAYDSLRERMVLFGGGEFWGPATDETWVYGCSLKVAPSALPDAYVGAAYAETLAGSGGTPPYTFTLAAGSLPAGLALAPSGAITGTPSSFGTATFRVGIDDAAGDRCEVAYHLATLPGLLTEEIVTGAGPGLANAPVVKSWDHASPPAAVASWAAYGATQFGVNVASADIAGGGSWEILTGPGPGPGYGPQVRGFLPTGVPIAKVDFYAYGTLRYGAVVGGGDVDGDGHHEILTGAGPAATFGPHVRGFDFDGGPLGAIAKISFFAYGTLQYGVRVAGGDVDTDGFAEILTGAGAGSPFAPHVRGFDYDDASLRAMPIDFFAFSAGRYGACVAVGSTDADPAGEIVVGRGPDPAYDGRVRGFDFTGTGVSQAFNLTAFLSTGGAEVATGSVDGDTRDEVIVGAGWGAANPSNVRVFVFSGAGWTQVASFGAYAGQSYGTKVAVGDTGTP